MGLLGPRELVVGHRVNGDIPTIGLNQQFGSERDLLVKILSRGAVRDAVLKPGAWMVSWPESASSDAEALHLVDLD